MRRAIALFLLLAGCSTAPVDRIEPATTMLLLPGAGEQAVIAAVAYDVEGEELPAAELEWRSEDPTVVEVVDGAAVARAIGWTRLVATCDDAESEAVLVYVAEPVDGAVLFARGDVLSGPALLDESPTGILGARLRLGLQGVAVQEGDVLVPTDDVEAAGRVVAVSGTDVTLEVIGPNELFDELKIDSHAELEWDEADWTGNAWSTVTYGPFECEATSNTEITGLTFTRTITPSLSSDSTLEVHLGDTTTATLRVAGAIDIELFAGIQLPDTYDGTIAREATILSPSIPVTVGWLKLLLNIEYSTYYYSLVDNLLPADFIHGLVKSVVFGLSIALTSCYFGIAVRGGAVGVGRAVNAAVVAAAVSIMVLDFFVTYLMG